MLMDGTRTLFVGDAHRGLLPRNNPLQIPNEYMPINLGKQIGSGGEGYGPRGRRPRTIWSPKCFHTPLRDLHIEAKLAAMIKSNARQGLSATDGHHVAVAWPRQVRRFPDGRIGYTMYYARGTQPLFPNLHPAREVALRRWNIDAVFLRRVGT